MTKQRGTKLGYSLPLNTDYQIVEKIFDVTKFPLHANQECILKRISELKSSKILFSMKSETDDGLSNSSNFPERPTESEQASPTRERAFERQISDKELDSFSAVLNRNAEVFRGIRPI